MVDDYTVDVEQLRAHATNIESLKERFAAVKAASTHIAQDDQAYGLLCGWISGVLEGRHRKQDELLAYVAESLDLVTQELELTADAYDTMDNDAADRISRIGVVEL